MYNVRQRDNVKDKLQSKEIMLKIRETLNKIVIATWFKKKKDLGKPVKLL